MTGSPDATTCCASSYTAPSTQPPETLPTAVPSGPTSIVAPAGRGAERHVATTVAIATGSPSPYQRSRSSRTSRMGDHPHQVVERIQGMSRYKSIKVRQARGHSRGQRFISRLAAVRVDPDESIGQPGQ